MASWDFDLQKDDEKNAVTNLLTRIRESNEDKEIIENWVNERTCVRYLRARNWNMDLAFNMLVNTIKWRSEYKPHNIMIEEIDNEAKTGKMYLPPTRDLHSRPIIVMRPGLDTTTDRIAKVKYLVWIVENAINSMIEEVEKMTLLVDYTGCGMAMAGIDNTKVSIEVLNILQNHYPERLGLAIMVNPPWIFSAFWKIISPLLDPITAKKIIFVKNKKNENLKIILDHISADQLEEDFGGSNPFKYDHNVWLQQHTPN